MTRSAKIAISLPEDLLEGIDRERGASGETRSQYFRRAVRALLRRDGEREAAERYVRGYVQDPETDSELAWVEAASHEVLAAYPWGEEAKQ